MQHKNEYFNFQFTISIVQLSYIFISSNTDQPAYTLRNKLITPVQVTGITSLHDKVLIPKQ